jgi:hypothetical protein
MPLYLCRWPNGDLSAVSAANKEDAVFLLDEVGSAQSEYLSPCPAFMVHFALTEKCEPDFVDFLSEVLEVEGFGEECTDRIWRAYPELVAAASAVNDADVQRTDDDRQALVDAALKLERERVPGPPDMSPEEDAEHIRRVIDVRRKAEKAASKPPRPRRNPLSAPET